MTHSEKLRALLITKQTECENRINKLKKKRKIINGISISLSFASIITSAIVAIPMPPLAITLISISSAVLIGINLKFKIENKSFEIKQLLDKLNKIKTKLEYVNSCNGNLTEQEYLEICKEFA